MVMSVLQINTSYALMSVANSNAFPVAASQESPFCGSVL